MSDKDDLIVAGVNQKDKGIWRDFYNRYYAALCSYVEKILFLTDAVEDLVQEVFISVWEGKRTFSDSRELTNYLYRACYNNALLYIRNHQIHDSILNGLPQEEDFEEEIQEAEIVDKVSLDKFIIGKQVVLSSLEAAFEKIKNGANTHENMEKLLKVQGILDSIK